MSIASDWQNVISAESEGVCSEHLKDTLVKSQAKEEPTSRKCEEQLSLVTANSCSSYKGVNRTTEMAQVDNNPRWDNLPSPVLEKIFSYLSRNDRISASEVCANWRGALLNSRFWREIRFDNKGNAAYNRFIMDCFGLGVHEATICCSKNSHFDNEAVILLEKLSHNRHLRKLFLECSSPFCGTLRMSEETAKRLMEHIVQIIKTADSLETLSLGCVDELTLLTEMGRTILKSLRQHQAKHLKHLSLASVKINSPWHKSHLRKFQCSESFFSSQTINSSIFASFNRLSILTIDYGFVTDNLLLSLNNGTMERLVIHVHSVKETDPGRRNEVWERFVQQNPKCELRLNIIHSYEAALVCDGILSLYMPLTHLKVLYCKHVNIRALHQLSTWYPRTLKSLMWVDKKNFSNEMSATHDPNAPDSPDPLVLIAWKCRNLKEIVFMGHKYYEENLLAIVRLRGKTLKSLVFAERDINKEYPDKGVAVTREIQEIMGCRWRPLRNSEVRKYESFNQDNEIAISWVLHDQK